MSVGFAVLVSACIQSLKRSRQVVIRSVNLFFALVIFVVAFTACSQTPSTSHYYAGSLPVSAPESVPVAQPVTVIVGPITASDGLPVSLTAIGSYGSRVYRQELQDGTASFILPATDTRQSGLVTLVATAGKARGEAEFWLEPGSAVEPLTPLVGARSIIADGDHWAMTTIVPFDSYGNPVAEGTPILIRSLHPDGELDESEVPVKHLLAWDRIWSNTTAGRTTIAVSSGDAFGPEADLLEVPGWPESLRVTVDPPGATADGRQLLSLKTNVLRDAFGNILPDGTQITFAVTTPENTPWMIPGITIDGVAEVPLQAASEPGQFEVTASVFGIASEPVTVTFTAGPAVGRIPLESNIDQDLGAVVITAGPLLGPLAQHVPDGTEVLFDIAGPGAQFSRSAPSDSGYATVEIRLTNLVNGRYHVEVHSGSGVGATNFTAP